MQELSEHIARAKESLYFSGARIDAHLAAFLDEHGAACEALGAEHAIAVDQLYLVGSGGSYASLLTAKYAVDALAPVAIDVVPSYDLVWRRPARLDERAVVLLASYSGETEDTVAALRHARAHGARTVAVVGVADSTLAVEADVALTYASGAIYEIPIAAVVLYAAGLAAGTATEAAAQALKAALLALPERLRTALADEEALAHQRARALLSAQHLYVLGAGPNAPLAYKVAMSVVMENVRIGATYSDACEWRHGPAEALERVRGRFLVLLGTDASRAMTQRTIDFCRAQGSDVLVLDAADHGDVDPLLTPLVLNSVTQWLVVVSAILRGITDLDERVFMGHSVLAEGGATWP